MLGAPAMSSVLGADVKLSKQARFANTPCVMNMDLWHSKDAEANAHSQSCS